MNIYGSPTISRAMFAEILRSANSPVLNERPGGEYYDLVGSYGLDAAFCLAVFSKESSYGTNPQAVVNRYGTRNWANCRTRRKATLGGKSVSTDRGNFWVYQNWYDSLDDLCYRLTDPTYAYAGKRTVEEVVPILAPPGDFGNDPTAYVRGVLAQIAAWQARDTEIGKGVVVSPGIIIPKPPVVISHTRSKFGYSKGTRQQLMICDHITAAGKAAYGRDTPSLSWLRDEIEGSPSVNYLIGRSGVTVEIVPPDGPAPWTNGIDYGEYPNGKRPNMANPIIADITRRQISPNQVCVTIEHEAENGGDMNAAQWAATIALHTWLCWRFKIVPDEIHLVGHNQWDGIDRPYCPGWTAAQWANLRAKIVAGLGGTAGKVPLVDDTKEDDVTVPAEGKTEVQIIGGQAVVVTNYGPAERDVVSANVNTIEQTVTMKNKRGELYDRGQRSNVIGGFTAIPK